MDNGNNEGGTPSSSGGRVIPPRKASSSAKWYAVIAVLIVIIAALAVVAFYKPTPAAGSQSSSIISGPARAVIGQPYNLTINVTGSFTSLDVYFGDGSVVQVPYSGSNMVTVSHIYQWPGTYLVYYSINNKGTVTAASQNLIPVEAGYATGTAGALLSEQAYGTLILNTNYAPAVQSQNYVGYNYLSVNPGSTYSFNVSYYTALTFAYTVVSQMATVVVNGNLVTQSGSYLNLSSLPQGYYSVQIVTETSAMNATGVAVGPYLNTTSFVDIAAFSNAKLYTTPVASGTFTNAEVVPGGYTTLDPAVAYFTADSEIMDNTMQYLVNYNGSQANTNNSSYVPQLASALPSFANGGINDYSKSWTATNALGQTYTETVVPYQNYTFHIRSNASWQDGSPVTAWDVLYSFARTLLFNHGAPETPGWIQSQYLLPGGNTTLNYYNSNTFYNITHNITVNNATNNITFHFQHPLLPYQVFQAFAASGAYITDAAWVAQHATSAQPALVWNTSGFKAYEAQGISSDYNTYLQNNVFSDGPYMISYILPSQEVVMVPNPYFAAPGPWYPAPSIHTIVIEYLSSPATAYSQLANGQANNAEGLPATTYWNSTQQLAANGILGNTVQFNTLSNYFFPFNPEVNMTLLAQVVPTVNMPATLFASLHAREAFANSFNYNLYMNQYVGNAIFTTNNSLGFGAHYTGMIPKGMVGYQNNTTLSANSNVPYFNLAKAKADWSYYINNTTSTNYIKGTPQITWSSTKNEFLYNGKPLVIPMFLPVGDTTDQLGEINWGQNLAQFIPGLTVSVQFTGYTNIYLDYYGAANPAPLMFAGWAPDYPYPNDYLLPMALPLNTSTYPGQYNMNIQVFNTLSNTTFKGDNTSIISQLANMTAMKNDYIKGQTSTTPANTLGYYYKMNYMLINMTMYVYTFQNTQTWQMSKNVNINDIKMYQENVVIGGGQDLMYNLLSFTS
jgi:peptide/nickel transport system substrate-binding protein